MAVVGSKHSAGTGPALSSINEGDEHVSLMDVLCARSAWLDEEELWAVCRECCLAIRTLSASSETFQTYCVTPDTLAFDMYGAVCLLDFEVDDLLCKPPEFYLVGNSYKGHVYSLGTTMLMAAHYNMEGGKPRHSRRLTQLLSVMTDQDYDCRADLESVLKECDAHMRSRSSRELCRSLVATVVCSRARDEATAASSVHVKHQVTPISGACSPLTDSSVNRGPTKVTHKQPDTVAVDCRQSAGEVVSADGRCAPPTGTASGLASGLKDKQRDAVAGCHLGSDSTTDTDFLRLSSSRKEATPENSNAISKSTGDLSVLRSSGQLAAEAGHTLQATLSASTESIMSHPKRPSAFTPRREIATTSAFTPFRQSAKGDISVRVYGQSDSSSAETPAEQKLKVLSLPAAYGSSTTHFTPIVLKSERKLLEYGAEVKDREAAKKIKELKKNLLKNLHPPNVSEAMPQTRSSAAEHYGDVAHSRSVADRSEPLAIANDVNGAYKPYLSCTNLQLLAPPTEYGDRKSGVSYSPAGPESPDSVAVDPALVKPRVKPAVADAARRRLPSELAASSSMNSRGRPEPFVPRIPSSEKAILLADDAAAASCALVADRQGESAHLAAVSVDDSNRPLDSAQVMQSNKNGEKSVNTATELLGSQQSPECKGYAGDALGAGKRNSSSIHSADGAVEMPIMRPRKKRITQHSHSIPDAEERTLIKKRDGAEPFNFDESVKSAEVPTRQVPPLGSLSPAAAKDSSVGLSKQDAVAAVAPALSKDVASPPPPPSPSLSKDSGVGLGLGHSSGDPVLMERLLASDGLRTRAALGRVLCLLRDEFSYDGYMDNGVEDLAMAEYVASLAGLRWGTFVSAVSEKYCDLYWQEELLIRLYEAINGKAPAIARRPVRVVSTAHVLRVDEPAVAMDQCGGAASSAPGGHSVHSPFRPISSGLSNGGGFGTVLTRWSPKGTDVTQKDARSPVCHSSNEAGSRPVVSLNLLAAAVDLPRSHSAVDKKSSRQLSRKRSASVQELAGPGDAAASFVASGNLSKSTGHIILYNGSEEQQPQTVRQLSLVPVSPQPRESRCGSACSGGSSSSMSVIRIRGRRPELDDESHRQQTPTRKQRQAAAGRTTGFSYASGRVSVLSVCSGRLSVNGASVRPKMSNGKDGHVQDTTGANGVAITNDHAGGISSPLTNLRSQSRLAETPRDGDKQDSESVGAARVIDILHYAVRLPHMNSESLLASSKLAESTDRVELCNQLSGTEQQIVMQTKQRNKALKYCRQLQAMVGGGVEARKQRAFDRRAVFEKAVGDVVEASDKLSLLTNTKMHLQMLLAEQSGLDVGLACSLAAADRSRPLVLPSESSSEADVTLLLYHESRDWSDRHLRLERAATTSLHAGTALGLSSLLYARDSILDQYIHHFFISYRYFIAPHQLLDFITEKYMASFRPPQRTSETNDNFPLNYIASDVAEKIQTRSLDLLQTWIEGFYSVDFKYDSRLASVLLIFYQNQVLRHHPTRADTAIRLMQDYDLGLCCDVGAGAVIQTKDYTAFLREAVENGATVPKKTLVKVTINAGKETLRYAICPHGLLSLDRPVSTVRPLHEPAATSSLSMDSFSLDDYSVQTLSEQLTLIEQTYFERCHPVYFMNSKAQGIGVSLEVPATIIVSRNESTLSTSRSHLDTPVCDSDSLFIASYTQDAVIHYMIDRAQSISHWVAAELVSCSGVKMQLARLKKFICIARVCREIRNYATCSAVLEGLENIIVRQLPVWKDVSYKSMEQLNAVKVFLKSDPMCLSKDPNPGRTVAPGALVLPTIPSILIFLVHVQQAELGSFTLANGMYKWSKLRSLSNIVDQIRAFQQKRYEFEVDVGLCERLEARIGEMRTRALNVLATTHDINFQRPRSTIKWMRQLGKQSARREP